MRIVGWAGGMDGCRYYRLQLPLEQMERLGHETLCAIEWRDRHPGKGTEGWLNPDVLIGQRVANAGASRTWKDRTDLFRIYELDDDLMNVLPNTFWSDPDVQRRVKRNIQIADRVIVSTQALADRVSQLNPDVVVVPNTIPGWVFDSDRIMNERLTVGYCASPTHAADWAFNETYLRRFFVRNPHVDLHTIGTPYGEDWGLPNIRHTEWVADVGNMLRAIDFNIGIAPLKPSVFNQSKSFIKVLELAALGIPSIASASGPYPDFIVHGVNGFLVRQPHEWEKYLRLLTEDSLMRINMGHNARVIAEANYRTEDWARDWEKAYAP